MHTYWGPFNYLVAQRNDESPDQKTGAEANHAVRQGMRCEKPDSVANGCTARNDEQKCRSLRVLPHHLGSIFRMICVERFFVHVLPSVFFVAGLGFIALRALARDRRIALRPSVHMLLMPPASRLISAIRSFENLYSANVMALQYSRSSEKSRGKFISRHIRSSSAKSSMVFLRSPMRISSRSTTSSGGRTGKRESAASNCGNSLTGELTSSRIQSISSVSPSAVSSYTVFSGRLPSFTTSRTVMNFPRSNCSMTV